MNAIVASARKYLGVKFRHRGRSSFSLDCAGLPWRAYLDLGVELPDVKLYGRDPAADKISLPDRAADAFGPPVALGPISIDDLQEGDVVIRKYDIYPHHVMIVGRAPYGALTAIHADGHYGKVIEHRIGDKLLADITHVFRRPI